MSSPVRESALTFVIDHPELAALPYCRRSFVERGLVPHLTVLYPWRPAPVGPDDVAAAAEAVSGVGQITVRLEGLATFPSGVVYAEPSDPGPVVDLMARVWAAFPETPPYRGEFHDPVPHVTLDQCDPAELPIRLAEVAEMTTGLWPIEVTFTALGVLQQDLDGRWSVINEVGLR